MLVGGLTVLRICPNWGSATLLMGWSKFGWFSTLKNWKPSASLADSQPGNNVILLTPRSVLKYPGPKNRFLLCMPNRPGLPELGANCDAVRQGWSGLLHETDGAGLFR